MPFAPGYRLGPYEIVSPIGAGGMGEVYRARDTRLDRSVAIKLLAPLVADDPQFRERFQREGRAIAALTHPHICTLYDVGEHEQTPFLVMELLDGETLATRLERGPLPLEQALPIAIQIADALDRAHRAGIVHRDLKPANVMLTRSGGGSSASPQVKLLDFGLARLAGPLSVSSAVSVLPTAQQPLTAAGSLLGTFSYMAPEQIEGGEADARTDIFAFGVTLYEMLTGKRPFTGKTPASTLGAILKEDPAPLSSVQPRATLGLERIVGRCLAKDPDDRWQTARDLRIELASTGSVSAGRAAPQRARSTRLPWIVAALATAAALASLAVHVFAPAPPAPVSRVAIPIAPAEFLTPTSPTPLFGVSRDGRRVAFTAMAAGRAQLFVRALEQPEAVALGGIENAQAPVFSPDGQWIAFNSVGKLKKVSVNGGSALDICDVAGGSRGAVWLPDDTIVFATAQSPYLQRVSANGGTPKPLTTLDARAREFSHSWPSALPDGRTVLFAVQLATAPSWDEASIEAVAVDTGKRTPIVRGGVAPMYADGRLIFRRGATLVAMPFDAKTLRATAAPIPVHDQVDSNGLTGASHWTVTESGTLVYIGGGAGSAGASTLVRLDGPSAQVPVAGPRIGFASPRISPDGQRVVVEVTSQGDDLWVFEFARGTSMKLTFEPSEDETPVWSPDGKWIAYASTRSSQTPRAVFRKRADGTGAEEKLWSGTAHVHVTDWSSDGRLLLEKPNEGTQNDLMTLTTDGRATLKTVLAGPFNERGGRWSPDGRWIAYVSDESGRDEVHVRSMADLSARWQVSANGGSQPVWSRDGRHLYYRGQGAVMAVDVAPAAAFSPSQPRRLLDDTAFMNKGTTHTAYDVDARGRFLFARAETAGGRPTSLNLVQNWFTELAQRVK